MANFNKVILAGNLTRDPELKYTSKGTAIASFGLAINRKWKTETGETKEEVTFVDIDAFGRQAEVVALPGPLWPLPLRQRPPLPLAPSQRPTKKTTFHSDICDWSSDSITHHVSIITQYLISNG
ncbi:MAG: single-stranded DNA-binding protein [Verrucomicrobia bacterium]|nr:single-stranded DNA-binding protein [Verrucomicrobiota bacterium]